MIGILVALAVSWLLLFLYKRSSLESLGLIPSKKRVIQLFTGLGISILAAVIYFGLLIVLAKAKLVFDGQFQPMDWIKSSWWVLKSVLFEELVFRGALLFLAIQLLGPRMALALSAIAFGIYHWFTFNVLGEPFSMLVFFVMTATAGFAFAYSFIKTKSMYLQTGLHFGWNFVSIILVSKGPLGHQFMVVIHEYSLGPVVSLLLFFLQIIILPVMAVAYLERKGGE